jgi:hypothetical protein
MYLYHADALALGGKVVRPVQDIIESQVACSLPTIGGNAIARSGRFDYKGLLSYESAQSSLTGGIENRDGKDFHVTGISIVIEKLNILNMVTADRIVARLAAEHGPAGPAMPKEPDIITTGCHFDGLRIAGHAAEVVTNHGLFSDLPTYAHWQKAWIGAATEKERVLNSMVGSQMKSARGVEAPHLQEVRQAFSAHSTAADLPQTVLSSFVRNVDGINGTEIDNWGSIIVVPQFGTIYLGEVIVSAGRRRLNMVRLVLGSPVAGDFIIGSTGGNGTTYP